MLKAYYHLPGLFEFYELYKVFLPIYKEHREYFYDWCEIGSVYGAPSECLWGGGRVGFGDADIEDVLRLMDEYNISARLTFSNSLLKKEHLTDKRCNALCRAFSKNNDSKNSNNGDAADSLDKRDLPSTPVNIRNGIIIYSDLLLDYINTHFPGFYFVSSTTKVITDFDEFINELNRPEFDYVVPDFRLNKRFDKFELLDSIQKSKVEFLVNECCYFGCTERRICYENVSRKNLLEDCPDHICKAPSSEKGYLFSKAMENEGFISVSDIQNVYLKSGFSNFKIEGRSLGSAMILEFLLYYMTKPEYQIHVREQIYLDSMLDLF